MESVQGAATNIASVFRDLQDTLIGKFMLPTICLQWSEDFMFALLDPSCLVWHQGEPC